MKTCITKGIVTVSLTAILLSCSSAWAAGKGGIGLAATRLVYSEGEEQISLGVRNTSPDVPYLIQSWVMTPDNKKSADFIITPPLFVLNPANENLLRIMYIGAPLAKDRETLFFTSVRAVPSTTKREEGNTLKIATQSVIKLFWRPKGLAYPLGEAPAKLRCTSSADMVTVSNPTPYFITLTDLKIGGKVVKNQMISPFDKYQFSLPKGAKNSSVTYRTINDYGAETPQLNCISYAVFCLKKKMYRTHRQHSLLSSGGVPSFIGGLVVFVSAAFNAQAETWFDPAFFKDDPSMVADLSRFEKGQKITPGVYRVDIVLNQTIVDTRNVNFVEITPEKGIAACLTTESLDAMGVNTDAFPAFKQLDKQACVPLAEIIPDASVTFNVNKLRLEISVPQIAIKSNARGYVPPERWDEGINALLLGYSFSGANSIHSSADSDSGDSYFLNLNSGVNLGPWRLRNNSTWSRSSGQTAEWKNLSSYLQRAVIPLKGELTVGDDYTAGDFFDSVSFRGVQLASDDNMLPDSLKGFAPVVRGIAKSNAQITIKQNGYTIYQTYVSPGAFEISDLYSTSSSGDLLVEIKEADGSVNSYSVPFSSVPLLQRQGRIKYAVTLAKYRTNSNEQQESKFAQATLQWGGPWGTTWYGGGQYAEYYRAAMFGLGFNLGDFGAISFDVTQAKSTLADQSEHKGQSYRFLYAKTLNQLGTNFQLMGYRYSTSGFYTLSDTMYKHMDGYEFNDGDDEDTPMWSRYYNLFYTKRGKLQVNISQQLGEYGSFYLSGSQQTYWHTDQQDRLLQFGYNTQIKDLSLGVSWNYSKSRGQPDADQVFALNFSLPLNLLLPRSNDSYTRKKNYAWMTSNTSIDNEGHITQNLGLTETLLDDGNLSYSVQQGYNSEGKTANGSASMDYKGAFADARVGYNYSDNGSQQQLNYALSGSLVAHSQGITLGQSLGETNVLIAAPGAENTRVANSTGLKTDWRGYTVVPYATSYRENRIALDAASLKRNVDLENAVVNVVPTKGALVLAEFNAHAGARVLMKTSKQGIPLRFGAIATLDGIQTNSGIIDDDGSLYMSGLPAQGAITVRWGEAPDQICHISYQLTEQQINSAITRMDAICR